MMHNVSPFVGMERLVFWIVILIKLSFFMGTLELLMVLHTTENNRESSVPSVKMAFFDCGTVEVPVKVVPIFCPCVKLGRHAAGALNLNSLLRVD
jgi:hypothetical protein